MSSVLKKAFRYNAIEFRIILDELFSMKQSEVKKHFARKDLTLIEIAAARQLMNALQGDIKSFEFALDRSIGRVKEQLEVSGPRPTVIRRKDGELVELGVTMIDEDGDTEGQNV